jgi:hypothetical protein
MTLAQSEKGHPQFGILARDAFMKERVKRILLNDLITCESETKNEQL